MSYRWWARVSSYWPACSTKPLPQNLSTAARLSPKMAPLISRRVNPHIGLPTATYSLWVTTNNFLIIAQKLWQKNVLLVSSCRFDFFSSFCRKKQFREDLLLFFLWVFFFHKQQKHMAKLESSSFRCEKRELRILKRWVVSFSSGSGLQFRDGLGILKKRKENGKQQFLQDAGSFFFVFTCSVKEPRFMECFDLIFRHQIWPQDLCYPFSPLLTVLIYLKKG